MPFGKTANKAVRRCTGANEKKARVRLFSLDLHVAVIADIKDVLQRLFGGEVKVHDWNIAGFLKIGYDPKEFGFASPWRTHNSHTNEHFNLVNHVSWIGLDSDMVTAFQWQYAGLLKEYDGFIVSHTPVFCRLFEGVQKPIVLVNSCRYDQPYCFTGNMHELDQLNKCLRRLDDAGLLIAISNNKADRDYLELGACVKSTLIPSLGLYTGVTYDPNVAKTVKPAGCPRRSWAALKARLASGKVEETDEDLSAVLGALDLGEEAVIESWSSLFQRQGLIHLPYEMSTMSLFEQVALSLSPSPPPFLSAT
jgi:hypothetical protein